MRATRGDRQAKYVGPRAAIGVGDARDIVTHGFGYQHVRADHPFKKSQRGAGVALAAVRFQITPLRSLPRTGPAP